MYMYTYVTVICVICIMYVHVHMYAHVHIHVHVLTCGVLHFGADGGDVGLTGVELVFSNCCDLGDDGRVGAVAESGGGGMVANNNAVIDS